MSRATDDLLAELHGKMAEAMQKRLRDGDYTASDLNVIRQFLKDNGINSDGRKSEPLRSLADDLPEDLDDMDNVTSLHG